MANGLPSFPLPSLGVTFTMQPDGSVVVQLPGWFGTRTVSAGEFKALLAWAKANEK